MLHSLSILERDYNSLLLDQVNTSYRTPFYSLSLPLILLLLVQASN